MEIYQLSRSNNDIVDGNKDKFDEESNKSHNHEPNSSTEGNFCKFYIIKQYSKVDLKKNKK